MINWEGSVADKMLVIRGADKAPIATIAVPGNGSVFATVKRDGQVHRMSHSDVLAAQAWCVGVLMAIRSPTYVAPDKPSVVMPAPKSQSAKPKGTPLERLLVVLRKDPDLAWGVCQGAKTLGPWVAFAGDSFMAPNADGTDSSVQIDWFQRTDATGFNVATVRLKAEENGGWLWSVFMVQGSQVDEVACQGTFETSLAAKAACDEYLGTRGWLLASQPG